MNTTRINVLSMVFAIVLLHLAATAQTLELTYQGSLKEGATDANGNYDFQFALFEVGGSQIGSTITRSNVLVTDGVFSVQLNFGNNYTGANRELEIRVRPAGGAAFTTLTPRQLLTATPYSIVSGIAVSSINATNATTATNATQLGGIAANQYVLTGDARLSDARNPLPGSANYIQNQNAGPQVSSNFNISGNGTAGGTLTGDIVNSATQYNLGGSRVLSVTGSLPSSPNSTFVGVGAGTNSAGSSFNSFFGRNAGQNTTTDGLSNSFFGSSAGIANQSGDGNSFFGIDAGEGNTTGNANSFFGNNAGATNVSGIQNTVIGTNADVGSGGLSRSTAVGFRALVTQSDSLVLGAINGLNGATADTNVGIGTTAPNQRLHVVGNGLFTGNLTVSGTLNATLPAGSGNYIQNQNAGPQASSNFSITGNGTAGGTISGSVVNAGSQFHLAGSRILALVGLGNLFVGPNTGIINPPGTQGGQNTFVGVGAGDVNASGSGNSFLGFGAGGANVTGGGNSFFGFFTGSNNTASRNSFFGSSSGSANTTGEFNSFFGESAGRENTTGANNSFFGKDAGRANATGSNNTIIGVQADVAVGDLTNATAIGNRTFVAQSNSLILGSIDGVNGATSNTVIGIGTTAPEKELHVRGPGAQEVMIESSDAGGVKWSLQSSGGASGGRFEIVDRTAVANRFTILSNGNIGIGTTTPDDKLEVTGSIRVSILGVGGQTPLCRNGSNQISLCAPSAGYKSDFSQFSSGLELISRQIEEQNLRFEEQQKTIDEQQEMIKSLRTVLCQIKAELEVCKEK